MGTIPGQPPQYNVTDYEILQQFQNRTLEPMSTPPPPITLASSMWSVSDLVGFLDYRCKRFLRETGLVVARLGFDGVGQDNSVGLIPGQESVPLPQNLVDVLRLAFVNYAPVPYSGVGIAVTPKNSGDNQNFTIPFALLPGQYLQLFVNGLLQVPNVQFTLVGTNLALSAALTGTKWTIAGFITSALPVTPIPSGDGQHFTLPIAPANPTNVQGFLNGLLLQQGASSPADFTISGTALTFNYVITGSFTLQFYLNSGFPDPPQDSGDHTNFTLPSLPVPPVAAQVFLNGLFLLPGALPRDYNLTGRNLALNYTLSGTWNLQAFAGGSTLGASAIQDVPREDYLSLDATQADWETTTAPQPYGYTRSITQALQAFLANPPSDVGAIDLTFVAFTGPLTGLGVKLGIPPEFSMYPLYGLMADAYSVEGEAYNGPMAQYCESRFSEGISIAKALLDAPSFQDTEEV